MKKTILVFLVLCTLVGCAGTQSGKKVKSGCQALTTINHLW